LKTATSAPGRSLLSDGAEARSATGITVFSGTIGVTLFGLFLTPVFYVGLRKLSRRDHIRHGEVNRSHG
jgi:multidrug efflux pump